MNSPRLILACLWALLLPAPLGMAVPLAARVAGASATACRGLAWLAGSRLVHELRQRQRPTPVQAPGGVRLVGRWRRPPGGGEALETEGALIAISRASGIRAPPPGTEVVVLARTRDGHAPMVVSIRPTGPPSGAWLDRWRLLCIERIETLLSGPARGLARALLLGDRGELQRPVQRHCRRTGTMHLLALSGLHVGVVALILARLMTVAGWPGAAPTGILLLSFVVLAGARPPLLRATSGWALLAWGRYRGREAAPLHRLAVVACGLLVIDPRVADDLGARLSFVAVAGLLAALPLARGPLRALVAPAGAVLATAPLAVAAFGELQPLGILVTPLLLPAVACVLALGVCCVLTGPLTAALDPFTAPLLQGAADAFLSGEAALSAIAPSPLHPTVPAGPPLLLSLIIVGSLLLLDRGVHGPLTP